MELTKYATAACGCVGKLKEKEKEKEKKKMNTNNQTMLTLETIKKGLLQGKKYGDKWDKGFRGFYYDLDDGLIKYNHYGTSAVKLERLDFVVNTIFGGLDYLEEKPHDYFIYA